MGMGRRKPHQQDLFITHDQLPKSPGHVFYKKLNKLLGEAHFDQFVEGLCREHYQPSGTPGRPSIPPGTYFRMLLVGYFEGIGSQRGIAWRCEDSLSLREFLGIPLTQSTPDHSSLTRIRDRLPLEVHQQVFELILTLAASKGLVPGKRVAVDSTTLEADAAMKSIVRRDSGEDWQEYVMRLMQEEGVIVDNEEPSDEEIRRFDKKRKNKRVSNDEWVSTTDRDARITRMKDGRTHLAYKAEHVIDVESELILAAEVYLADHSDSDTLADSLMQAVVHVKESLGEEAIEEVVADKGYHSAAQLELVQHLGFRSYIPEPQRPHKSRWTDKPPQYKQAVYANRRRTKTKKNKRLQRLRSERVERSFAHVCETGGARRTWLHGIDKVRKRLTVSALTRNLGLVMRKLFGVGTPRGLQLPALFMWLVQLAKWLSGALCGHRESCGRLSNFPRPSWQRRRRMLNWRFCSTGS